MRFATRATATLPLGLGMVFLLGCPIILPGGSTDLTTPASCTADTDCPDGITCIFADGTDQDGFCDIEEMLAP